MPLNEDFTCKTMIFEIFRAGKICYHLLLILLGETKNIVVLMLVNCSFKSINHDYVCTREIAQSQADFIFQENSMSFQSIQNFFGVRNIFKSCFLQVNCSFKCIKHVYMRGAKHAHPQADFKIQKNFMNFHGLPKFSESEKSRKSWFYR